MSEPLKYLFDEMDKQQNETIKNLDKINRMLGEAAEEQKEEVLPNVYECRKCGETIPEESANPKTKQGLCGYCSR